MTCALNEIKELLPEYVHQELDGPRVELVERHLASCDDCRNELSLITVLARETVPDPGALFWTQMALNIERDVRLHPEKRGFGLRDFSAGLRVPGLAWAAVVLLTMAAFWFAVRPAPLQIVSKDASQNESVWEDSSTEEAVNLAELTASELQAAGQWARNELGPIGLQLLREHSENTELNLAEDVSDLNAEELTRLYEMLKKKRTGYPG